VTKRGHLTIAGLGPAGSDLMTEGTRSAIETTDVIRLRTSRHPAAESISAESYDHLYDTSQTFDEVYSGIVEALVVLANRSERVLYLVPGSPVVAEATVEKLMADGRVECEVLAAMSFLDLSWARLGIDPVNQQVQILDGHNFRADAHRSSRRSGGNRSIRLAGQPPTSPLLVAQCSSRDVLSNVKLGIHPSPATATLLHHLGLADEQIVEVPWADIDRTLEADHLTSLYIPSISAPGLRRRFGLVTR